MTTKKTLETASFRNFSGNGFIWNLRNSITIKNIYIYFIFPQLETRFNILVLILKFNIFKSLKIHAQTIYKERERQREGV